MDDKQYDYKQAGNKDLSFKERFDYLENARHDADTPNKMIGNVPPAPSSLINPFSPQAQATAAGIYGNQQALQNSVNAPNIFGQPQQGSAFQMEDDSPLEGNAFSGALQAAKAKGDDTFQVSGKTYSVK